MKTEPSVCYFVGTDGKYKGVIFDDEGDGVDAVDWKSDIIFDNEGNEVDAVDWKSDIPSQPLPVLIVDSVEKDEYGRVWGRSGDELFELFTCTEGNSEFDEIRQGYREVRLSSGEYARLNDELLYCQASDMEAEL